MASGVETLDRRLRDDVLSLGAQLADDESAAELYRALANIDWRREDAPEGHISLSWSRAEGLVNELRARHDRESLELAQTGGEGDVSDRVAGALGRLGWSAEPMDTSRHDERHVAEQKSPPPPDHGRRTAPVADPGDREQVGHGQADEALGRLPGDRA
jgi:hypothetical protein